MILECIEQGYQTIDDIKRVTRAGMGPCQGRTCRLLIAQELSRAFGIPVTTLRRKAEEYGLPWAVDKSEKNIDRYKRVKTVE